MRKLWISLAALALFGQLFLTVAVQAQTNDPLTVVKAFVEAYNRGDVEQTLAYFADDAVVKFVPAPPSGGSFSGKEQIRAWLVDGAKRHNRLEVVGNLQAAGNKVTGLVRNFADDLKQMGVDFLEANVETIVVNGKITSNSVNTTPESLAKLPRPGAGSGGAPGQSKAPVGAPAAGAGGTAKSTDESSLALLIGLLLCGSLVAVLGLRLAKR